MTHIYVNVSYKNYIFQCFCFPHVEILVLILVRLPKHVKLYNKMCLKLNFKIQKLFIPDIRVRFLKCFINIEIYHSLMELSPS
jgi:hypothetical protein